ncbi:MAG: hypothetical protein SPI49_02090 [Eubacteriales bacterium]|nr:hypothetical protein [Eubacteriales bacterium]
MSIAQSIDFALLPGTIAFILVFLLSPIFILYVIISTLVGIKQEKREFAFKHPKSELEAELVELNKKLADLQNDRSNRLKTGLDITGTDALINSCKFDIEMKQKDIDYYFSNKLRR